MTQSLTLAENIDDEALGVWTFGNRMTEHGLEERIRLPIERQTS